MAILAGRESQLQHQEAEPLWPVHARLINCSINNPTDVSRDGMDQVLQEGRLRGCEAETPGIDFEFPSAKITGNMVKTSSTITMLVQMNPGCKNIPTPAKDTEMGPSRGRQSGDRQPGYGSQRSVDHKSLESSPNRGGFVQDGTTTSP